MKLIRYLKASSQPRLGVVTASDCFVALDPSAFPTMLDLVGGGAKSLQRVREAVAGADSTERLADVHLLAPIERPGKYLAIGMNYAKHAAEVDKLGIAPTQHQTWFNKQTTCISGPFDPIDPGVTEKLDYEVELGLVIGMTARHVAESDALSHVFGYFVANDVSARDWQFHSPTFTMGKSFDTHGPIGPWIVTADEIPDPQALDLKCWVNGELRQDSNTAQMVHPIAAQIAYLATAFTLEPGDLIATGTPEGVGVGLDPPRFLKLGDVVVCGVQGIGEIRNTVASPNK